MSSSDKFCPKLMPIIKLSYGFSAIKVVGFFYYYKWMQVLGGQHSKEGNNFILSTPMLYRDESICFRSGSGFHKVWLRLQLQLVTENITFFTEKSYKLSN
jgi:hypothetical protein